jgi:hypothetical protein
MGAEPPLCGNEGVLHDLKQPYEVSQMIDGPPCAEVVRDGTSHTAHFRIDGRKEQDEAR